jgi:uracil-DNA glycosylase
MKDKKLKIPFDIKYFFDQLRLDYREKVQLPNDYYFFDGTKTVPIVPVLPKQLKTDSIMIVGTYPSAQFKNIDGTLNVPIGNLSEPFEVGTESGDVLERHYLEPLGIKRELCWITTLLKIFLFKEGDIDRYEEMGSPYTPPCLHADYELLAGSDANLKLFDQELALASPKLVITLGAEVAGILHPETPKEKWSYLMDGELHQIVSGGRIYKAVHLVHPVIIMRRYQKRNPWPRRHEEEHIPKVREIIRNLQVFE